MIPSSKRLYEENVSGISEIQLAEKYKTTRAVIHGRIYRYKEKHNLLNEDVEEAIQTTVEIQENTATATIRGSESHVKTLDELIEACEIDTDIWEIYKWLANKWDMTNKYGERYQNWQVKAQMVRLKPINVFPELQPVHIDIKSIPRKEIRTDKPYRVMTIGDPHFGYDKDLDGNLIPYHNEEVLSTALRIFEDGDFDCLVWAGDIIDCNEWSDKFIRMPEFVKTTQPALNEAAQWIARFIAVNPEADFIALEGNHDYRIEKYVINALSQAYQLKPGDSPESEPVMGISNLLGLKRMGVEYKEEHVIGSTKFVHGGIARKGGGSTAKATLENTITSVVFAHVHRRELVTETKIGERNKRTEVFSMCPGCACHTDGRLPGSDYSDNWQNGIGVLEFLNEKCISHQVVMITNEGDASFSGKVY